MKRIVIIAVLLGICAAVSIYCLHHTREVNEYVSASVARSFAAMEEHDLNALKQEIDSLSNYWIREEFHLSRFVRHAHIDDITKSVSRLRSLAEGEDFTGLSAELAMIRWQIEHIEHSERLILQNLF